MVHVKQSICLRLASLRGVPFCLHICNVRSISNAATVFGFLRATTANLRHRAYDTRDFYAIRLDESTSPSRIAQVLGARYENPIRELSGHHMFSRPNGRSAETDLLLEHLRARQERARLQGTIPC